MKRNLNAAAQADNDGVIDAPKFRTPISPRRRVRISFDPATDRTQQSFKDDCDINKIMSRYLRTGQLPQQTRQPIYLDTTAYDFLEASNLVAQARGEFSLLPAEERDAFGNQVELWLDYKAAQAAEAAAAADQGVPPSDGAKGAQNAPTPSVEAPAKPDTPAAPPGAKPGKAG